MDYTTSGSWQDFFIRQAAKLPLVAAQLCDLSTYPVGIQRYVAEGLLTELPMLFLGAKEYLQQQQTYYQGRNSALTQKSFEPEGFGIAIHAGTEQKFELAFPRHNGEQACDTGDNGQSLYRELRCAASTRGVGQITLQLAGRKYRNELQSMHRTLRISTEGPGVKEGWDIPVCDDSGKLWATDLLSRNAPVSGEQAVLSLWSGEVLHAITNHLNGTEEDLLPVECQQLEIRAIGGQRLQFLSLGALGYFLVDHSLSQGVGKPIVWFSHQPLNLSHEQFLALDSQLQPSPEYGV